MPVIPTYPGVYIEELPSGVRTITGVSTSMTAFIGRALRGKVNEPVVIHSYGDFEKKFGGLWNKSTMSFAVWDYFLNGGKDAVIVRLYNAGGGTEKSGLTIGGLSLEAASEGAWGDDLRARIDHDVTDPGSTDLFNLYIRDGKTGSIESFLNVSVAEDHKRRVDKVLENESRLVRVSGSLPGSRPAPPSPQPPAGEDPWKPAYSTGVTTNATDGVPLAQGDYLGSEEDKEGIYALEKTDIFNLLCIPPYETGSDVETVVWDTAAGYCEKKRAVLIVDAPSGWASKDAAKTGMDTGVLTANKNAAIYFPRLIKPNIINDNQEETFAPCGAVAGVIARTDSERGIWKAPAGLNAGLRGVTGLSVSLTDDENGELNPRGLNCIREKVPAGKIVWGSRTLMGDDRLASEWKYLPVRRVALYIEESLYRGLQWVVFEPNDERLWGQIRLNTGSFMQRLFRQGAFKGLKTSEAYLVKCDSETTTDDDINRGVVNILVGFAPLKPAEFVFIRIQQLAGQTAV